MLPPQLHVLQLFEHSAGSAGLPCQQLRRGGVSHPAVMVVTQPDTVDFGLQRVGRFLELFYLLEIPKVKNGHLRSWESHYAGRKFDIGAVDWPREFELCHRLVRRPCDIPYFHR